jgi:hypothetical protein
MDTIRKTIRTTEFPDIVRIEKERPESVTRREFVRPFRPRA